MVNIAPMQVTRLAKRYQAVGDALQAHGWEANLAADTAAGIASAAYLVTGLDPGTIEAMLPISARLGIQLLSGPDWLILIGPHSRLGAFARPWSQPEAVQSLAIALGMAMPPLTPESWQHSRGRIPLDSPVIMAIVNLTPDSFSDGGRTLSLDGALRHCEKMLEEGAGILDLGGESTAPQATPVSQAEELRRVIPVVDALSRRFPEIPISIDTVKAEVARVALDAGAGIVNDVTAGRNDPALLQVSADAGAGLILSHSRGPLEGISALPPEDPPDLVTSVVRELKEAWALAKIAGVADANVVLDPGFGFGKGGEGNLRLLAELDALVALGRPVLAGVSRKRFLGGITGKPVTDRDQATAAASALAVANGAVIVRVHSPAAVRDAVLIAAAMIKARPDPVAGE